MFDHTVFVFTFQDVVVIAFLCAVLLCGALMGIANVLEKIKTKIFKK